MNKFNTFESIKCIWMSSGVVDYKLCDRKFNCDNCFFDKAMKNTFHSINVEDVQELKSRSQNIIQRIMSKIGNSDFKKSYIYFNNNLVVKNLFDSTYYLGLCPVVTSLLDNFTSFENCSSESIIKKGDKIIKINGDWGEISISSPIGFKFLDKIINQNDQPYSENWFGLVEISKEEIEAASVSISNYHRDIINITKELDSFVIDYPDIGNSMYDGGQVIRYLYQAIGKEKYLNILKKIFNTRYKAKKV